MLLGLLAGAAPCADAVQNVFGADLLHRDQRQRLAPPALAWLAERSAARSEGPRMSAPHLRADQREKRVVPPRLGQIDVERAIRTPVTARSFAPSLRSTARIHDGVGRSSARADALRSTSAPSQPLARRSSLRRARRSQLR